MVLCLSGYYVIIISLINMAVRKRNICGGICVAISLGLLIFALTGLHSLIDGVVLDGVVLAPDTVETWGYNPGKTGTLTLRNFTFYNLTNPREYLYRGKKPIFHEINSFLLQELSNFTDIKYSSDRSYIDYNYWLHFSKLPNSRPLDSIVTVLNVAPLGFWSQLQNIDLPVLAIQGFGGLFSEMNATIKMQAIGQGVAGQFLANYSVLSNLCSMIQIDSVTCKWLWEDPLYGLNDPNKYEVWVDFSYYNQSDSEFLLYEYFKLRRAQLQAFDRMFERWCFSIDSILDNSYCGGSCTNYQLTILQLSSSGVTRQPPSGQAADSICLTPKKELRQNDSCQGFPELYSFYTYQFPKIDGSSKYENLVFSQETVRQLYSPGNGTLLNVGNLTRLFRAGEAYDRDKSEQNLQKIMVLTHAQSLDHAYVIWQYVKYFSMEFVLQSKDKGTKKIAGLGGVFSQALYQSFTQFSDWILEQLLSIKMAEAVPNCTKFILDTVENLSPDVAATICQGVDRQNYKKYAQLLRPCNNEYYIDIFKDKYSLLAYNMDELCNVDQLSILTLLQKAHADIATHYGCKGKQRCTGYQLALYQFISSNITNNPLTSTVKQYPPVLSGHGWDPQLQEWEYRHFLKEVYGDAKHDPETYQDYNKLSKLLSFDRLFNGPMVQNLTLVENPNFFSQLYYFTNKTLLMQYIRFVTIEVGFGGFTQKRTVNELLFGYEDPFLKNLKEMDPMLGGDPSIASIVALNEPNATLKEAKDMPQSMYTGYSDPLITRNYRSYQNKEFITYNHTYYDGYKVITEWQSPYMKPAFLTGTDAMQQKPMSSPQDNQYVFIDSLYRVGQLAYDKSVQKYGFDIYRYKISQNMLASSKEYPPNANFYQGFTGFMNLSFMGLPLFAGKNHFLGAEPKWRDLVQIYDQTGKWAQYASEYDETEVLMEPKSGATFVATIYLQTNVYLAQDVLFTREPHMLPVFTIYRSGNLSESAANQLLGDLKVAIAAPTKLAFFCAFIIIFSVFCMLACNLKQERAETTVSSSLLSSTHGPQQVMEEEERNSDLVD